MAAQEAQAAAPAESLSPPPAPQSESGTLSRNQLKKQKKAAKKAGGVNGIHDPKEAALTDHAPAPGEIAQGKVDASLLAPKGELGQAIAQNGSVTNPEEPKFATVEFVSKRIRNLRKKIDRIMTYAHKPRNELNDDQKKSVDSLPGLQGAFKELEEVRKGLELIEIEQTVARETQRQLDAADAAAAVASAVQAAQEAQQESFRLILGFVRFYQALMQGAIAQPSLSDLELQAIHHAHGRLLHPEDQLDVMRGLMAGEGELEGVEYVRLRDILSSYLNPVPEPTPAEVEAEAEAAYASAVAEAIAEQAVADVVAGSAEPAFVAAPAPPAGGFMFMNPDELDPATGLNGYEQQQLEQQVAQEAEQVLEAVEQAVVEAEAEAVVQEAIEEALEEAVAEAVIEEALEEALDEAAAAAAAGPTSAGPIDWAAHGDDGELPDIGELHAALGSTGVHTPEAAPEIPAVVEVTVVEPVLAAAEPSAPPAAGRGGRGNAWGPRGGRGAAEGGERSFRGGRGGARGGGRGGFRGGRGGGAGQNGNGPYTPAAAGVPGQGQGQNGHAAPQAEEEDGWVSVPSKRGARGTPGFGGGRGEGRGRGRGEFRGRGGEYRGRGEGFRGRGGQGGERGGEFRGRGMRGGNRGARGAPNGEGAHGEAAAPAPSS